MFEFRPESAISPVSVDTSRVGESARFGANWAESQPHQRESAKKKGNHVADAARRTVSGVPRTSPRRAASDASAAPLEPRLCIPN